MGTVGEDSISFLNFWPGLNGKRKKGKGGMNPFALEVTVGQHCWSSRLRLAMVMSAVALSHAVEEDFIHVAIS